jgi:predicted SAM-dependent methyltransferase
MSRLISAFRLVGIDLPRVKAAAYAAMKKQIKRALDWTGVPLYWLRQSADEFHAMFVRIWRHTPITRAQIRKILARSVVRLNFGCGETYYEGWCGIDRFYASNVALTLDLRRPLPFPDCSVDYCYSEHFLEHLYPDEGQRHLKEVHRVLRLGGRYRIVVPDVMKFAKCYLEGDVDFFHRAFPWAHRPMQALYCVANWEGNHRNILDFEELKYMGQTAGFAHVIKSHADGSDIPALRIDKLDAQRVEESLYVEFIKRD